MHSVENKFDGFWGYVSHLHPLIDGHHPSRLCKIGPGMHPLEINISFMDLGNMPAHSILMLTWELTSVQVHVINPTLMFFGRQIYVMLVDFGKWYKTCLF